ncbi:MAG: MBL fold metallo-hydrolase [Synergistota bacterium]|nr:MBL fold metallo-hydrolase [Synergistota bacterium]
MLKLIVLVDNNTLIDRYFTAEPGLSFWIEADGRRIIFDTGYSDIFIKNAAIMGINVSDADMTVLSHGHNDHTWGLNHLVQHFDRTMKKDRPEMIAHPGAFERKRCGKLEIGMILREDVIGEYFKVSKSRGPVRITDKLLWLGEIPRKTGETKPIGQTLIKNEWIDDHCPDDSALAYEAKDGLVIITGCSHSGICNMIDHAIKLTGIDRVVDVIGGFHLQNAGHDQMENTVRELKRIAPDMMHPCHCTDMKAKIDLGTFFKIEEVGAGLELNYE